MRLRIQSDDGRQVEWEQDGPLATQPGWGPSGDVPLQDVTVILTEDEARDLWLELGFYILKLRHPERYRDRDWVVRHPERVSDFGDAPGVPRFQTHFPSEKNQTLT